MKLMTLAELIVEQKFGSNTGGANTNRVDPGKPAPKKDKKGGGCILI